MTQTETKEIALKQYPKTKLEALVYFISQMDAEMVGLLLDDDKTYQDVSKPEFIKKLKRVFGVFEYDGAEQLQAFPGVCVGCSKGCGGYTFMNKRGYFCDILFKLKDGEIEDIYECNSFSNGDLKIAKVEQVYLTDDPFNTGDFDDSDIPF